jgi:hypothetical protein
MFFKAMHSDISYLANLKNYNHENKRTMLSSIYETPRNRPSLSRSRRLYRGLEPTGSLPAENGDYHLCLCLDEQPFPSLDARLIPYGESIL